VEQIVSGVGVVDKVVAVLGALETGPASLAELQTTTGLPRATAHRLATALETHGLVRRGDDGRFVLGLRLVALGQAAGDGFPLAAVARPVLIDLRDRTGESVQLYVREGDGRRCVASLQSPHALRWIVPEGALLPIDRGSAGRVLTDGSAQWKASVPWKASVEEREIGVASVSAPVRDQSGQVVAAVSVSGPIERLSRDPGARFGPAVASAAEQIERALKEFPPARSSLS
jgi:DNA-binding IclR family transcriptional regulator